MEAGAAAHCDLSVVIRVCTFFLMLGSNCDTLFVFKTKTRLFNTYR